MLSAGVGFFAGAPFLVEALNAHAAEIVEIRMLSDSEGGKVYFDPIGVLVKRGQRVRWRCVANVHTTTAYHPRNNNHSLRIPQNAQPWNSSYLLPGQTFEVTLAVEGVYDYFCIPHEAAGMVGRIIVGKPVGPGSLNFDYYKGRQETQSWRPVPKMARAAFPPIAKIMANHTVRRS